MAEEPATGARRRTDWERVTTVPLVVLGVVFIVAYTIYVLAPWIPRGPGSLLFFALVAAWLVFVIDVVVRIALTPRGGRWKWVRTHPIDVLSAIIPVFRAFRVLSLLREVPYLQRRSGAAVRANIIIFGSTYAVVFVYFIALATLQAERNAPGATITTFGDSIWWAIVTIATVGYGDMYPVTTEGRFYAVFLMAGGVAIVGTASATIISYIGDKVSQVRAHHSGGAGAVLDMLGTSDAADAPPADEASAGEPLAGESLAGEPLADEPRSDDSPR
ncbi:potassium channel family protein [Agromyces sp. NPDC056965]|uniref:potassium channel family protein n=1 Tax=Agromyces sp. NPDC056965 TaxID=3345983 RepID=UPI0036408668